MADTKCTEACSAFMAGYNPRTTSKYLWKEKIIEIRGDS